MILGEKIHLAAFSVRGFNTAQGYEKITDEIVRAIGMNKVHAPVKYDYPVGGKGGFGWTYIQPITESYIIWDAWPDLCGAYLLICSCKEFDTEVVKSVVDNHGLDVVDIKTMEMGLPNAK